MSEIKNTPGGEGNSNLFLTGAILMANMDAAGLMDYAVKALVGGLIWMGCKLAAEYFSEKLKKKKENKEKEEEEQ